MKALSQRSVLVWLLMVVAAIIILLRTTWLTDMSVFLPTTPTTEQKLLISSLQHGQSARSLLASAGPLPQEKLKPFSLALSSAWREIAGVHTVSNGNTGDFAAEQSLLSKNRYLLTGDGKHDPLSEASLGPALIQARAMLASSAGLFNKDLILADPTGAGLKTLGLLSAGAGPARHQGVWIDASGTGLLFALTLDIDGADLDQQEALLAQLQSRFDTVAVRMTGADANNGQQTMPTLSLSGAPVFTVQSREEIRSDVMRLSSLGMALIIGLLLLMFRSARVLLIALVPLFTAVLVGASAVALGFGSVHALTLGFGVALIGECVDYALYHLVHHQSGAGEQTQFWAPIRLGLLTSLIGFTALLFSDFPGLSQLAVLAMAGLTAGYLTTRYVLPALTHEGSRIEHFYRIETRLASIWSGLQSWRAWTAAAVALCLLIGLWQRDQLWSTDIAALNPVSAKAQELDARMRNALGGPDINNMVLVQAKQVGGDALVASVAVTKVLRDLVSEGKLRGLQSPTDLLPPASLQHARQQQLPDEASLRARIKHLKPESGLSEKALAAFIDAVSKARTQALITADDYKDSLLEGRLQSMLSTIDGRQIAIITLDQNATAPLATEQLQQILQARLDAQALAGLADPMQEANFTVLNMKAKTDALYSGYIRDALTLSLTGAAAIVLLLAISLRSLASLIRVCVPIAGALAIIVAGFALSGTAMHLLHLVGLLLVAAIGSNYALVLSQAGLQSGPTELTLTPLVLANLTTVAGFGVLAFSNIPLLAALGTTVGFGAPLVLVLAAIANARPASPAIAGATD